MFHGTYDRAARADRYRQTAAEYASRAQETNTPYMRAYFHQIADEYLVRADGELRTLQRESLAALATAADAPSVKAVP